MESLGRLESCTTYLAEGNTAKALEVNERRRAIAEKDGDNQALFYKTKLNKLLFCGDFVNYYLHGRSISGAAYVHLPYG